MAEPARRRDPGECPDAPVSVVRWSDLNFHRPPDIFLPMVSPTAWKVLCGILVNVWSRARHILKTNKKLMEDTGLKRSALISGLRELEKLGIITCIKDPDYRCGRVIQLNWTLKLKTDPDAPVPLKMVGQDRTDPVRPAEPPPSGQPNLLDDCLLKGLGAGGPAVRTPPFEQPDGGARRAEPPPVRPFEPPSYLRDSKEREGEKQQQEGPASSSCPDEGATTTPAEGSGFRLGASGTPRRQVRPPDPKIEMIASDRVLASGYLLGRSHADRLRRAVADAGKRPPADLVKMLAYHDAAAGLLGEPAADPHSAIVVDLARSLSLGKSPAAGPVRQDRPGRRRGENHP